MLVNRPMGSVIIEPIGRIIIKFCTENDLITVMPFNDMSDFDD